VNKGFTLIESVIYLACSLLLVSLLLTTFGFVYNKSREQLVIANRFLDILLASDYITKDIQESSIVSTEPLVLQKNNVQYCWLVRSQNLIRIQKNMQGKSTSLVARHINHFSITPYAYNNRIKGVTIRLSMHDLPERLDLTLFVATRGGATYE
jgi:ABC-type transport system involved in Fe-S cluster assembly fused permease/ATPase subunit